MGCVEWVSVEMEVNFMNRWKKLFCVCCLGCWDVEDFVVVIFWIVLLL